MPIQLAQRIVVSLGLFALCVTVCRGQDGSRVPSIRLPEPGQPLVVPGVVPPVQSFPDPVPRTSLQPSLPPPTIPVLPGSDSGPIIRPPSLTNDELFLTDGSRVNLPNAKRQLIRFSTRYGNLGKFDFVPIGNNTQRLIYTGGLIINITYEIDTPRGPVPQDYEFAADNLVMWIRGAKAGADILGGLATQNTPSDDNQMEIELFLNGNVIVRSKDESFNRLGQKLVATRTLRAEQIYYDVNKNKAIAQQADLELMFDNLKDSVHIFGTEINRLSRSEWEARDAGAFSSKLPSDPSIKFRSSRVRYSERDEVRRNIFGLPYRSIATGEIESGVNRTITSRNARVELLGLPVFYLPYLRTDPAEPLGPLKGIGFGNDRIFGTQLYTTFDAYKLLALRGPPAHSWRINADFLSDRGPALGTDYNYRSPSFFGFGGPTQGIIQLYGLSDGGVDVLGGERGPEPKNPAFRGRALWQHQQDIIADRDPDGDFYDGRRLLQFQRQFAYLSDKNFYEQYFKVPFDFGPNQESYANLTYSTGKWYGTALLQAGQDRDWVTETRWLPKASGALLGQSLFDRFTYNSRIEGGYAQFRPADISPFPVLSTEQQRLDTGRFDWWQELSLPVAVGPLKVTPYGILDLTAYSNDLTGESRGRVYGGGGAKTALTFSRLYSEASSELFNLRGLNHKATLHSRYLYARTDTPFTSLPLLDRLNDDAVDQAYRNFVPFQNFYTQGPAGLALTNSPIFNPQRYAIRRLVDNKVDTRDNIQVVQLGLDQRLQTKRGFPGRDHTVDWLSFNLSASLFPQSVEDNFGKTVSFLEYDLLWNVGDQTAFVSQGWFDPFDLGARYYNVGAYLSRPDNTNFYFGYRQADPIGSKAVIASFNYQFNRKYGLNVASSYDFGTQQAISNTLTITRTGTDLTVYFGVTYNALVNNFGIQFSIVPNLAAGTGLARFGSPFIQ